MIDSAGVGGVRHAAVTAAAFIGRVPGVGIDAVWYRMKSTPSRRLAPWPVRTRIARSLNAKTPARAWR
jgi:hypothetical protein